MVKFCFRCPNEKLVTGTKYHMCEECEVRIPKDDSLSFLANQVGQLLYCYACGEKLIKGREKLLCLDGCGMKISLTLITSKTDSNQEQCKQSQVESCRSVEQHSTAESRPVRPSLPVTADEDQRAALRKELCVNKVRRV